MESCELSLKWLNSEALTMMGPFVSCLATEDVNSSPNKQVRRPSKKDEEPMSPPANVMIFICSAVSLYFLL